MADISFQKTRGGVRVDITERGKTLSVEMVTAGSVTAGLGVPAWKR